MPCFFLPRSNFPVGTSLSLATAQSCLVAMAGLVRDQRSVRDAIIRVAAELQITLKWRSVALTTAAKSLAREMRSQPIQVQV